jgi:iduronate 2-sulfatase
LLNNPTAPWDKPAYTQVWRGTFPGHSVRTERYRYIEWDNGRRGAQLYDYTTDPAEERNLIADPAHADTVAALRALVRDHWTSDYRPSPDQK